QHAADAQYTHGRLGETSATRPQAAPETWMCSPPRYLQASSDDSSCPAPSEWCGCSEGTGFHYRPDDGRSDEWSMNQPRGSDSTRSPGGSRGSLPAGPPGEHTGWSVPPERGL